MRFLPTRNRWIAALLISLGLPGSMLATSTIEFSASTYTVGESAGSAALGVQRIGDLNASATVQYATADGTATNGLKYTAVSGMLTFQAGETNLIIVVPLLNAGTVDGTKSFRVVLSDPSGGALLGPRTNVTVFIIDNDAGLQFQFSDYAVVEDQGAVMIGVVRGDDGTLPVAVDFATTDLTATNGLDYTGTTNTLSFAPQERLKLVPVPILNNSRKQPSRLFRVTLAKAAGATLGIQKTATVMITDNDQGMQFEFGSYSVAEDAGAVRVRVLRGTDDTNAQVTVDFATTNLTATHGLDYTGITNTLSFAPGERLKQVAIPILNDGVKEPSTENFRVTLSNPTGGAVFGSPTAATVTIADNDPGLSFELSSYSVRENEGSITVLVRRGNDVALGPVTVAFATSDSTAKAGRDYQAVSGTLAFQPNETLRTITIPILRDDSVTTATSFRVTLSNPTDGASLGTPSSVLVNILDATGLGTYRTLAPPFDPALTIRREGDRNILTWVGGGRLQRADNPAGPWETFTNANASSPYTVQSAIPASFYRVSRPRPVEVYVPSGYDGHTPVPLVILLHGYGGSGAGVEDYMQVRPLAEARGFLYCSPDSAVDRWGNQFWNAADACCDFASTGVDDAGYLRNVIEEMTRQFTVDRKRIHLIGHSNGGWMSYRMACESADLIAGIASLAGMTSLDPSRCRPAQPVNILHIHGTADSVVPYVGGALLATGAAATFPANLPPFPSALQTVQTWTGYNGTRDPIADPRPSMDLDLDLPGLDTRIIRYASSPVGGAVELWTIQGGSHGPLLHSGAASSEFVLRVIDWLLAHPKP